MSTTAGARPCAFYMQGKCSFGDTCRFPHIKVTQIKGTLLASTPRVGAIRQCTFYEKDCCTKGRNCPFSHDIPSGRVLVGRPSLKPAIPPSIALACHFFKQGACKAGISCPYSHVIDDVPKQQSIKREPLDETFGRTVFLEVTKKRSPDVLASPMIVRSPNEQLIEREIDGSRVMFAPGPVVRSVDTVFDTRVLIATNLPHAVSNEDVLRHIKPLHECTRLTFDKTTVHVTARLEFSNSAQAVEVSKYFDGLTILGSNISARLDNARILTESGSLRSTKVKVSWFKPSRIAWAHYSKYRIAQREGNRLQGKIFDGQKLSVEVQSPTRGQTHSFSIVVKGLPQKLKKEDIVRFCRASTVTLGEVSFDPSTSYQKVKELLKRHGTLESVEPVADTSKSNKLTIFAHYRDWREAENACKALHLQQQLFLRYSMLLVENIHAIRYNISQAQYEVIKWELLSLQRRQDPGCKLRIYDETDTGVVCIRGYSSSAKSLTSLKVAIDVLIRGDVLKQPNGGILWDDRLSETDTQESLLALARKHKCWINFDVTRRRLLLFGSPANCKSIGSTIIQFCDALKTQSHTIPLDASTMRGLITGGLRLVEQVVGEDRARLDVRHRTLEIKGSDAILLDIKKLLDTLDRGNSLQTGPTCPVCLGEPINPTTLACGHSFCTECITGHLKEQSKSRNPDCSCFFTQGKISCKEPIGNEVLRRLLTPDEEGRILKAVYLSYIHSRPQEFMNCPTPDCATIYRPTAGVLRCPTCATKICSSCKVEYHDGFTCKEYDEELKKELAAMESWKKEHDIHSCPNCQSNLQKEEMGCNHLVCIQCSRHICWTCMDTFEDSGSCYKHMGVAHGGIGGVYQGRMSRMRI